MSDTITVNITSADINVNVVEAGALWGSINGTITNQTDLVNYIGNLGVTSPYKFAANNTSILPINGTNVITVSGTNSVIAGGNNNTVSGYRSGILGGASNIAACSYAIVVGGANNTASSTGATIGGGNGNCICTGPSNAVIAGGARNTISSGYTATIGGGEGNYLSSEHGVIAGGCNNSVSGSYSAIVGGENNCITPFQGDHNFIGGGVSNTVSGYFNSIAGGKNNIASGDYSFVAGGKSNNTNNLNNTFILGSNITAISANFTYVNNLSTSGSICAGTFYGDGSNLVGASLPGQAGINTLVRNTSGNWNTAYNVATSYSSVSSTFATYTDVNTLTSLLVTNTTFGNYQTNVANTTATLLPTSVYQNASGSFATNTALNAASGLLVLTTTVNTLTGLLTPLTVTNTLTSLLTPLTLTKTLTGLLVKTTDLNILSATLLTRTDANTLTSLLTLTTTTNNLTGLLTPLTVTNNLTGLLVKTTDLNTLSSLLVTNTALNNLSGNWQSTYITVSSLSANWNTAYATSTAYSSVSSTFATNTTINTLTGSLLATSIYQNASGSFITAVSGTAGQINASKTGSTVTLSFSSNAVFPGNVTIQGNLSAQGTATFANTIFTTTSALCAIANSSGPALYIGQQGSGDLASFYDLSPVPVEVLHVGASVGIPGVGVYTSTPNKELTVVGEISATKTIYASGGNSNQWNNVYSYVNSTSATNNPTYNATNFSKLSSQVFTYNNSRTSTIYGGNSACGNTSSVYTSILGGYKNIINDVQNVDPSSSMVTCSVIVNGTCNQICGGVFSIYQSGTIGNSTIGNGYKNKILAGTNSGGYAQGIIYNSSIESGSLNLIKADATNNNAAFISDSYIGGGCLNCINTGSGGYLYNTCIANSTIGGGTCNSICSNTGSGYYFAANTCNSVIINGCCNVIRSNQNTNNYSFIGNGVCNSTFGSGIGGVTNYSFIGNGCLNTAYATDYATVINGSNNIACGVYSFIASGSGNNTNNKNNTFILGSNITAISANYTYVNNISSLGIVSSLGGNSNQWNNVYSLVSTTTATTFNVNNLTTSGKVGVKQAPLYFDTDAANIGNSYGTFGIGASNDISITPNNNLVLSPAVGYNVGVNTSAPNQKLTVVGNISSTAVVYASGGNSNNWNSTYTSYNTTSASFATTLSLSATTLKVYDKAVTYSVALSDNNSAIHLDTTSASISALFPSNLTEGFSVALMNTGTNYLYLSSALPLVSLGNSLSGKGSGAFTYVHSGSLYAVGRF